MTFKSIFSRAFIFVSILCSVFFISASEDPSRASALRKTLIAILQLELATQSSYEGFASGVIVQTISGPRKIEDVKVSDLVLSKNLKNGTQRLSSVLNVTREQIPNYIKIVLEDETIITTPGQKFYLPKLNLWVTAFALSKLPSLQEAFPERILAVECLDSSIEVCKLTIADEHNFYIGEKQLLVHNFVPVVVGFSIAFGLGDGIAITGIGCGLGALGVGIWKSISKDRYHLEMIALGSGVQDKEDKLPKEGEVPFEPQKSKDGKIPRDRQGGFIDKHGRSWRWDPKKGEWDVQINGGRGHINVNPQGNITH